MNAVSLVLSALVFSAFALFTPARVALVANQVVNNCSSDTELRNDLSALQSGGGGTLTFHCGTATIPLTGGVLPAITTSTTGVTTFTLNQAPSGGAIHVTFNSTLTMNNNSVLSSNKAGAGGGGIYNGNIATLTNVTLNDNEAVDVGGGISTTHLPLAGSAAIDNAPCTDAKGNPITEDQRGIARPQAAACDAGAVEPCTNKPAKPILVSPGNGKKGKGPKVALDWNDPVCAGKYNVVVRVGSSGGAIVFSKKNLPSSGAQTGALVKGQTYYWQVTGVGDAGKAKSAWWKFVVK